MPAPCGADEAIAYRQYEESADDWVPWTWRQFADAVSRWQQALSLEGLQAGDRVAVMLKNSREWAAFDMAALGLGLVVVPLFVNDRADNVGLILEDCGSTETSPVITVNTLDTSIPRVGVMGQPWTIDAGLMTPTLKLKRAKILEVHGADVDRLYARR